MNRTLFILPLLLPAAAWSASDFYVYPAGGQSEAQQRQDRYECHAWAVQQSGFDPSTATAPVAGAPIYVAGRPPDDGINPVTGAAGGAAMGAVGGAIGGDAGRGAAIGAGVGAVAGLLSMINSDQRERERVRQQAAYAQQQQAQTANQFEEDRAQYMRAISACLEGRSYVVR